MKKILALILAVIMCMAVMTACSGKKTIVVGYTIFEPMNYKDANGELVGFDTELAKTVFEKLGYEVSFKEIVWENKYTDLESGTIDCIWNGFTANTSDDDGKARSEKVDFSYNYMKNYQAVVVKVDSGITTVADLAGKLGVAETGSAGEEYAATLADTKFKGFTKQTECLTEVKAGTADFAVIDVQLAKSYVGKGDYADLMIVDSLASATEFYAIGFKKGSELTAKVNEQLAALGADGTIAKLAEKYGIAADTVITDFTAQKGGVTTTVAAATEAAPVETTEAALAETAVVTTAVVTE